MLDAHHVTTLADYNRSEGRSSTADALLGLLEEREVFREAAVKLIEQWGEPSVIMSSELLRRIERAIRT